MKPLGIGRPRARRRRPVSTLGLVLTAGALALGGVTLVAMHALREAAEAAALADPPRPATIPATWTHVDGEGDFHLWLPPDLGEIRVMIEEGRTRVWRSPRMSVMFDYSDYCSALEDVEIQPPMRSVKREAITVSGQPAILRVTEVPAGSPRAAEGWTSVAIHVPRVPRKDGGEGTSLTVSASCRGAGGCAEGEQIVRSLALRWRR